MVSVGKIKFGDGQGSVNKGGRAPQHLRTRRYSLIDRFTIVTPLHILATSSKAYFWSCD